METTPLIELKALIESDTPREWIIRASTENPSLLQFVEKKSLCMFEMEQKDMVNIAIEMIEHQVLHDEPISWQPEPRDISEPTITEDSEKELLIS